MGSIAAKGDTSVVEVGSTAHQIFGDLIDARIRLSNALQLN